MHKNILIFLLLSFSSFKLICQVKISGTITDINNLPLKGAKVYIDSTYDEAVANEQGYYELLTTEKGRKLLVVHNQDFYDEKMPVFLDSLSLNINIKCVSKIMKLQSVEITSDKNASNRKENDLKNITSTEVVTTVTDGNIISAFKLMPGVQQIGESGELFARGGSGYESKLYIDGMLVDNYLKTSAINQTSTSRFPANLFNSSKFVSGGYSSEYGQALSSVMLLETNNLPYRNSANISFSPIFLSADATMLNKHGNGSYSGSFSYTNLNGYTNLMRFNTTQNQRFITAPVTYESYFQFKQKTIYKGLLKIFCNYSNSLLSLVKKSIDNDQLQSKYSINNTNLYSVLKWNGTLKGWKIDYGFSWSSNRDYFRIDSVFNNFSTSLSPASKRNNELIQTKLSVTKEYQNNLELTIGGELRKSKDNYFIGSLNSNVTEYLSAGYTELKYFPSENLTFVAGGRYEYSTLLNGSTISPRLKLFYSFNKNNVVTLNYGDYYQRPSTDFFLYYPEVTFKQQKSSIYSISFLKKLNNRFLTMDVFYKDYKKLIKSSPTVNNSGYGNAAGFEMFFKDRTTFNWLEYWISYSYLDTKRIFMDYPVTVQPSFAASHTLSVVSKIFLKKPGIILSPSYSFSSGRPYYNPNKPASEFMSDKTIPYSSLNLNVCYLTNLKGAFTVIVLTMSNALMQKQIFGYTYSIIDYTKREEITPFYKSFVFLGAFISFGIDNRKQIIDEHL